MANERKFGIGADVDSKARVLLKSGISLAMLEKVEVQDREYQSGVRKGDKTKVLVFNFVSTDRDREYPHTEWQIDADDADYDRKYDWLVSRIKHMWEAFAPFPKEGIGNKAKSFENFFELIAEAFNTGNNGKPIYAGKVVWVKLTYYKTKLGFPSFPNFIDTYVKDKECLLQLSPDDKLEPTKKGGDGFEAPGGSAGSGAPGGAFPNFPKV